MSVQTRVDRMLDEFRKAQSRRLTRARQNAAVRTAHVPPEYLALYAYLKNRHASVVALTFAQIEALLGFALPTRARTDGDWWTNGEGLRRHVAAWTSAGRFAAPDLDAGTVTFERLA